MDLAKADLLDRFTCLLELLIRLFGESDDHVGCQGWLVEKFINQLAAIDNALGGPASLHSAEHGIGTTLQADMQVRADPARILCHQLQERAGRLGRLDAGKANPEITLQ